MRKTILAALAAAIAIGVTASAASAQTDPYSPGSYLSDIYSPEFRACVADIGNHDPFNRDEDGQIIPWPDGHKVSLNWRLPYLLECYQLYGPA